MAVCYRQAAQMPAGQIKKNGYERLLNGDYNISGSATKPHSMIQTTPPKEKI